MHIRVTWGRVQPGRWDDYEAAYRTVVAEGEQRVPGLRGRMLLRDAADPDSGGTLSLWEDEAAARAYEQGQLRTRVLPQLEQFFTGSFVTHVCELRLARGLLDLQDA
jgi:heme-degrading monooxygenase HmoA